MVVRAEGFPNIEICLLLKDNVGRWVSMEEGNGKLLGKVFATSVCFLWKWQQCHLFIVALNHSCCWRFFKVNLAVNSDLANSSHILLMEKCICFLTSLCSLCFVTSYLSIIAISFTSLLPHSTSVTILPPLLPCPVGFLLLSVVTCLKGELWNCKEQESLYIIDTTVSELL